MGKQHKHAEIIKAWADGAEIQFRGKYVRDWRDVVEPRWEEEVEYRVKPAQLAQLTPCQQLGYAVGDIFFITGSELAEHTFIAKLAVDDGTGIPLFYPLIAYSHERDAYDTVAFPSEESTFVHLDHVTKLLP